jgi:hypothetical protein
MAQQKDNKDLADALAALAAGDHVEPEAGDDHGSEHIEAAPPPSPPPPARPAAPQPAALRSTQPPAVPPSSRARPATPSPAIPQGRPASPQRPPQPTTPLIPPRSARPVSPTGVAPPPPVPSSPASEPSSEIIDDEIHPEDDAMLAPAPDPSMLAHPLPYRPSPIRRGISLDAKRTLIPILLTTGLLLLVFGALRFVMGADSPYAQMPSWLVALVGVSGLILLAGAFFTMLQVQHELDRK